MRYLSGFFVLAALTFATSVQAQELIRAALYYKDASFNSQFLEVLKSKSVSAHGQRSLGQHLGNSHYYHFAVSINDAEDIVRFMSQQARVEFDKSPDSKSDPAKPVRFIIWTVREEGAASSYLH